MRRYLPVLAALLLCAGCPDEKKNEVVPPDAGADTPGEDADSGDVEEDAPRQWPATGAYADVKATPTTEELLLDGLNYPVHVQRDEFGIPHILAENVEDAIRVQGFVHARDRFPQMELLRRTASGTLGRVAGGLDDGVIEDDIFQRVVGLRRMGQAIWDGLPEDDLSRRVLEAYTAGVNAYIARLATGEETVVPAAGVLIFPLATEDWSPVDSLTLVRFQQYRLGYDSFREIGLTRTRVSARENFSPDSENPAMAARAGIYDDLVRFAPADSTYQVPGFEGESKPGDRSDARWKAPSETALETALNFSSFPRSPLYTRVAGRGGISNSWAISGDLSTTGNAMLANDPHLNMDSPALFHQIHIVVEPRTEEDGPGFNVMGAVFPGLPGILIGHNEHVAWGLTTASYDYTDAFVEEFVWEEGAEYPKVLHNGEEVELELIEEEIEVGLLGTVQETLTVTIPVVPHHGPLAARIDGRTLHPPEGDQGISLLWRGNEPSNEIAAVIGWMTAENLDDVRASLDHWVIGTQNLLFADTDGNIFTTGESFIPTRPADAMSWHPVDNPDGNAPWWTLSGTGEHDWTGSLDRSQVPQSLNPPSGYLVTANNDQAGVTEDNNPLNAYAYVGYDYDLGFRAGRITRLIEGAEDKISLDDMGRFQTDTFSNYGERLTPHLLAAADAAIEAYADGDSHPELARFIAAHPDDAGRIQAMRDLLGSWSFEAENGMFGEPTAAQVTAANQTSLFNFWATRVEQRAIGDELSAAPGFSPTSQQRVKGILWILEHAEASATFDAETGESVLWDDLATPEIHERRDEIILEALLEALTALEETFGSDDPATWLWGRLHTRVFESIIPDISGGVSPFTWPQEDEPFGEFGFPRSGDNFNVDACNGGTSDHRYRCGGGAILRLLVELDPDGIVSYNALPGGQVWDPAHPHFRDLLDYWLEDRRYKLPFHPADVSASPGDHAVYAPE